MFKRKKIRQDFEQAAAAGDEDRLRILMDENDWLVDEWEATLNQGQQVQRIILSALGVMEDEMADSVAVSDITYSLRVDFKETYDDAQVTSILQDAAALGHSKQVGSKWSLTPAGGKICDNYLNSRVS